MSERSSALFLFCDLGLHLVRPRLWLLPRLRKALSTDRKDQGVDPERFGSDRNARRVVRKAQNFASVSLSFARKALGTDREAFCFALRVESLARNARYVARDLKIFAASSLNSGARVAIIARKAFEPEEHTRCRRSQAEEFPCALASVGCRSFPTASYGGI